MKTHVYIFIAPTNDRLSVLYTHYAQDRDKTTRVLWKCDETPSGFDDEMVFAADRP